MRFPRILTPTSYPPQKEIRSLQALRALAAILVVVYHAQAYAMIYVERYGIDVALLNATQRLAQFGSCGVDIFFVLSGFIITHATRGKHGSASSAGTFLHRRIARIAPTYWFYTSVVVLLQISIPGLFHTAIFDARGVLLSYLFIPFTPAGGNTAPVLQVGWTLTYELYFYALIALGLLFERKTAITLLGAFLFACVAGRSYLNTDTPAASVATSTLLLEFYAGVLIALLREHVPGNTRVGTLAVFTAAAWYAAWLTGLFALPRLFEWGTPAALLVLGCGMLEQHHDARVPRWAVRLGDASYSIYLSNALLIPAMGKLVMAVSGWQYLQPDAWIMAASCMCALMGTYLFHFIEVPLSRLATGRFLR